VGKEWGGKGFESWPDQKYRTAKTGKELVKKNEEG